MFVTYKCPCWAVSVQYRWIAHLARPVTPYYYKSGGIFEDHSSARGRKAIFGYFLLTIFSTPVTLVIFYSPSVMHFRRIGSVIICPTAKYLLFLAKCMYLSLWSCGVERYLPLSAVLGGFCVALQKGFVSPRLYTLRSKTDSQPASLPDKRLWNSKKGGFD